MAHARIENKPEHGDIIISPKGAARAPYQEFIDLLVQEVNAGLDRLDTLREEFDQHEIDALALFVARGYGGIGHVGVPVALPNISAAFQTIPANEATVTTPRAVVQDVANDALTLQSDGIWALTIFFTLEFVDINAGRTFEVRLENLTDVGVVERTPVFVGRNQAGINFGSTFLVELIGSELNDLFVIQIGNAVGGDFTGVTLDAFTFDMWHVSEALDFSSVEEVA